MIGKTVSHYRIEAKLGEGGMGVVYRARDLELNRSAAVKFISAEAATEDKRRRFQQEALTASSLNHPHILTVYEAGTADGQQFLITEFIDGCDLREWVQREQPSLRQLMELAATIADALACAHEAGIVHRDIKPGNILVSRQGYAKLVDFGLAKLMERPAAAAEGATRTLDAVTRPGVVVGTIPYMAPETISGKPADGRSDIFSFGAVLYEVLAAQKPFPGKSDSETLLAILHSTPRPLAEVRPDAPYLLRAAIEKAIEKDPADRYQSARELAVDLRRAQRERSSAEVVAPRPAKRKTRRRWATMLAGTLLVLAGVALKLYRSDLFWVNPLQNARFQRIANFESTELDASISQDGRYVVFLSDRDGVNDTWLTQIGTGHFVNLTKGRFPELLLDHVRSIGFTPDASNLVVRVQRRSPIGAEIKGERLAGKLVTASTLQMPVMGGPPRVLLDKGLSAAWSPDGSRLVFHTPEPGDPIFTADRNGNNPTRIFVDNPGRHCHFPIWSADARFIYFVRCLRVFEADIWRIPVGGGQPERITYHNSWVRYPAVLDDRTLMYTATAEDGSGPWLYAVDLARRVSHRVTYGIEQYFSVSASYGPNGRRLVATVGNPTGNVWEAPIAEGAAEESVVRQFAVPATRAVGPRYSRDYILFLSSSGGADGIWKFKDGTVTELWKGSDGAVTDAPATSPDGREICFSVRKNGQGHLYLMTSDGTSVRPLAPLLDVAGAVSWSPDGKWIVVSGDDGHGQRLLKISTSGETVALLDKPAVSPEWSPDGRLIVYEEPIQSAEYPLRAVTAEGKPVPMPDIWLRGDGYAHRFLPDGKGLVFLQGGTRNWDFWLYEFAANHVRRLTRLKPGFGIKSFDVSPDGKRILFDRIRENSDVVLIDLPK